MTSAPLWLGFGCRRGCSALEMGALLFEVLSAHELQFDQLHGMASLSIKAQEPGLLTLASQLQLPLITFCAEDLAPYADRLSHRSARAYAATGCLGAAESAALALAERRSGASARLLVTRHHTPMATLAIATVAAPHVATASAT
jgi:cobalt-precorrin 5A hydrolase